MKKIGRTVIFILVFFLSADVLPAEIGIKAGGLLSFAGNNSAVYNASNRFGIRGGVFWSLGLGPVSIRSGIDLARKGARYYSAASRARLNVDMDYVIVPVLLNVHVVGTPVDVFAGPYGGILIRSTDNTGSQDWTSAANKIRRFDFGVEAGIRYRLLKILFLELQFDFGLADAVYNPDYSGRPVHKNRTLSLLIGLRL
jgi:hypothetical protein